MCLSFVFVDPSAPKLAPVRPRSSHHVLVHQAISCPPHWWSLPLLEYPVPGVLVLLLLLLRMHYYVDRCELDVSGLGGFLHHDVLGFKVDPLG